MNRDVLAVVVTALLPRADLYALKEAARCVAFVLALTTGVTASLFSNFGPRHEITDATDKPTQALAVAHVEVIDVKPALLKVVGVANGARAVIETAGVCLSSCGRSTGNRLGLEKQL